MSILVDPFDSMSLGFGIPPGWSTQGKDGTILSFSQLPTQNPKPIQGGIWSPTNPHQYFNNAGPSGNVDLITPSLGHIGGFVLGTGFRLDASSNTPTVPLFSVLVTDNGGPGQLLNPINEEYTGILLNVILEDDLSITLRSGPGIGIGNYFLDNSNSILNNTNIEGMNKVIQLNTWYYFSLQCGFSFVTYELVDYVKVGATFYIDGIKVCDSTNAILYWDGLGPFPTTSGQKRLDQEDVIQAGADYIQFYAIGGTQFDLSQLDIESTIGPPTQNPNVRVSQLPAEWARSPSDSNLRVSQLPIELSRNYNPNLRVSQLVIELATKSSGGGGGGGQGGPGWIVSEA